MRSTPGRPPCAAKSNVQRLALTFPVQNPCAAIIAIIVKKTKGRPVPDGDNTLYHVHKYHANVAAVVAMEGPNCGRPCDNS